MRAVTTAALVVIGCYHPTLATDVPCGQGNLCPDHQVCDTGHVPPICVGTLPADAAADVAIDAELVLATCGDTSGLEAGAPWPLIHGCPTNAGRSAALGPTSGATAVDPVGTTTARRGAVVAVGNRVVVQETSAGVITSYDATTGMQQWSFTGTAGTGIEPFPAIDNHGVLYATTNYGKLFAVDLATGMEAWELQLGGAFSAPVIAAPGTIYYGSVGPYGFYAVDTVTHMQKWHYDVPNMGDAKTAPAIGNGRVYFVDTKNSRLFALDAETGSHVYDVAVPGVAAGSAVLAIDTIYVATSTGIVAFDDATGATRWQQAAGVVVVQPALLRNGDIVSSTTDGNAFVLARADGTTRYTMALGGKVLAPPIIDAADTIYFATDKGTVAYATSPRGTRWQSLLAGPIVIADQRVIVLPAQHTLAVIGP